MGGERALYVPSANLPTEESSGGQCHPIQRLLLRADSPWPQSLQGDPKGLPVVVANLFGRGRERNAVQAQEVRLERALVAGDDAVEGCRQGRDFLVPASVAWSDGAGSLVMRPAAVRAKVEDGERAQDVEVTEFGVDHRNRAPDVARHSGKAPLRVCGRRTCCTPALQHLASDDVSHWLLQQVNHDLGEPCLQASALEEQHMVPADERGDGEGLARWVGFALVLLPQKNRCL